MTCLRIRGQMLPLSVKYTLMTCTYMMWHTARVHRRLRRVGHPASIQDAAKVNRARTAQNTN